MPRMRGGVFEKPQGPSARFCLNGLLFGDQARGGHDTHPDPALLPFDWAGVFGRRAPLALEIGFNRGRFLRALAERFPERDHVGIEIRRRYPWVLAHTLAEAGPENVRIIWGDGKALLPSLFGEGSVSHLYINFPDPWWKSRHAKRRLVDSTFAARTHELLAPEGRVWVKSDVPAIAEEIQAALETTPLRGPIPFEEADLPLTHRERRCLQQGLPITRYAFEKPA
ncbi:tRNA (guanosine(46)-N7)-methyltransferase TrmB [Myxococcota bacterium]|nr:tRNA (guanosine(46)-N7)-methyltransferase TrmB [Myxococcota bacterium]MBU1432280.1 tRNA (guanosine(46)-N7)-methyltransferase TrmB [Myxococcota bacterium]MBU1897016.1 tRNA (guanosine(46)-N7)-methyltransferase TrmB [Myxococcota bacterium]